MHIPMTRGPKLSVALLAFALCALFCAQNVVAISEIAEAAAAGELWPPPGSVSATDPALGADIEDCGGPEQLSPLCYAAHAGDEAGVRLLLENGADVSFKDSSGWTPLHRACTSGA